ncbi:MAG: hypothetical protein L0287_08595, partial [Anaerolineae bacterium]|nr:hypothetical protein [Anaerolineae bacterium]
VCGYAMNVDQYYKVVSTIRELMKGFDDEDKLVILTFALAVEFDNVTKGRDDLYMDLCTRAHIVLRTYPRNAFEDYVQKGPMNG